MYVCFFYDICLSANPIADGGNTVSSAYFFFYCSGWLTASTCRPSRMKCAPPANSIKRVRKFESTCN